jgi:hypothetical protein
MTMQEDPFAAVRLNQRQSKPAQQMPLQNQQQTPENDPFADVRIKSVEGMPWLKESGRHIARIGSRIAETIGGMPGDVQSLIQSGVFAGLEKLTGHKASPEVREEARIKSERSPTTAELRKFSQEATGGFTEPQSDFEKMGDEIVTTAASLLGPMKFRTALGAAVGSQAAKEGLKILGTGEGAQEAGKLGTMFLISTINPKGAMNFASGQYDKANKLAKGASIAAPQLQKDLTALASDLKQGVTTSAKNVVLKPTEELLTKIQSGKIPVQELTAAKRDINTLMGDPALLKRERNLLKTLGASVDKAIKPFEKINPEFSKAYRPANEIYGAVMQGSKASNSLKKILGPKSVMGTLVGEGLLAPEYILPTAAGAAGIFGAAKTYDFITRVAKSPELQKYYIKGLAAAAAEDSAALRLYEDKLEEALHRSSSEKR